MKKILITGASGFIGGFLVEEALNRNLEVHAGVRPSSKRTWLQDSRIHFFENNFSDIPGLTEKLRQEKFDYIIHNAGTVAAKKKEDFFWVNCQFVKNFVQAIQASETPLKKFVFISSIAASGPASSENLSAHLTPDSIPSPVTTYGESKLAAEKFLKEIPNFPYIILRPTAVYGPREQEIFAFFKILNLHLETYIGFQKQHLTFIYVKDLVKVILDALLSDLQQKLYFITDGNHYPSQDLGRIGKEVLNKKTLKIHFPIGLAKIVARIVEAASKIIGANPALDMEKVNELSAMNWKCDLTTLKKDLNFSPKYDLETGLKEALIWYKENKWL